MKRYSVVRIFNECLNTGDIGVFIGESLSDEAFLHDRVGNLYLPEEENMLSVALGMAMCSDKRTFIFCDDSYFVRNISEAAHIAISKCENVFLVVLVTGVYSDLGLHPTIFNSIGSPKSMLYNMGFKVHNYTQHFKNSKNPIKEIRAIWNRVIGPLAVTINVDCSNKKFGDGHPNTVSSLKDIKEFITNKDIPSYNYVPPLALEDMLYKEE